MIIGMKKFIYTILLFLFCCSINAQHIFIIAGDSMSAGFSGDGGPALASKLDYPASVCSDTAGNIYIADAGNNRIRMISKATAAINTLAGGGANQPGEGDTAWNVSLTGPARLACDQLGNVYFYEAGPCVVRKIDAQSKIITTVVGTYGSCGFSGDGGQAVLAQLNGAGDIALDEVHNLIYIADSQNHRLRKVDLGSGVITTVAGTGLAGSAGDGGLAVMAQLDFPAGVAADSAGNVYVSDNSSRIRKIDAVTGIIDSFAGTTAGYSGDGGPAQQAAMNYPRALTFDRNWENLYLSDVGNNVIRKIDMSSGVITHVAGGGQGYVGHAVHVTAATLSFPEGLCMTTHNDIVIADTYNNIVRRILGDQTGYYHTFPDSNAVWNFHGANPNCGLNDHYYSIVMTGDTNISSTGYNKLFTPALISTGGCFSTQLGYLGCVREDTANRKVYFIPSSQTTETLLYDFNLQPGDSVEGYLATWAGHPFVYAIDSVQVGSGYRKRWFINQAQGIYLIEGIGCTYGLVKSLPSESWDVSLINLICFQQEGQTLYPSSTTSCDVITSIGIAEAPGIEVDILPNPAETSFTVRYNLREDASFRLINVSGAEAKQAALARDGNSVTVHSGDLPAGIYYYVVTSDEAVIRTGKISILR